MECFRLGSETLSVACLPNNRVEVLIPPIHISLVANTPVTSDAWTKINFKLTGYLILGNMIPSHAYLTLLGQHT